MVLKRMFFMVLIVIIINAILISPIYAMSNVISSGKNFLQQGQLVDDVIDKTELAITSDFIFNMFFVVAIVIAVGTGTVIGIKFMISSVEEQAKLKEALVPYVVGCIVIFGAFPIWSFIVDSGQSATGIVSAGSTNYPEASIEDRVYYAHSDYDWGCKEDQYWVTKHWLKESREGKTDAKYEFKTRRMQCPTCHAISVFDTTTYAVSRLKFPKCPTSGCEEYLQFNLSDFQKEGNEIRRGRYFLCRVPRRP